MASVITQFLAASDWLAGTSTARVRARISEFRRTRPVRSLEDEVDATVEREMGDLNEKASPLATEGTAVLTLDLAKWRFGCEEERMRTFDTKATALLGQCATTLSIVFAASGFALQRPPAEPVLRGVSCILLVAVLLVLVWAAGDALAAVRVARGWQGLKTEDLFRTDIPKKENRELFLALVVWRLSRVSKHMNDRKAAWLSHGQGKFQAALVLLSLLGIALTSRLWT